MLSVSMGFLKRKRGSSLSTGGGQQQDWSHYMADRLPPEARDAYMQAAESDQAAKEASPGTDPFAESLRRAESESAPPGKVRGVAKMIAGEQERAFDDERGDSRGSRYWNDVVFEVHIPGRAPYRVEMGTVRMKRFDVLNAGYPVLINSSDADDVDVQFDEMPESGAAAGQRMQEGLQSAMVGAAAMDQQAILASLAAVTDPQQRAQLVERLRAMGYEIPPEAVV
jgi:hypothetical protein